MKKEKNLFIITPYNSGKYADHDVYVEAKDKNEAIAKFSNSQKKKIYKIYSYNEASTGLTNEYNTYKIRELGSVIDTYFTII